MPSFAVVWVKPTGKPCGLAAVGDCTDALERPGRLATVTGWGDINQQDPGHEVPPVYANRMRAAQVPRSHIRNQISQSGFHQVSAASSTRSVTSHVPLRVVVFSATANTAGAIK